MKSVILFLLISLPCLPLGHHPVTIPRCLIDQRSAKSTLKQSAAVFSGEVLEVRNGQNWLQARFRLERSWKGIEGEEALVLTDDSAESPHYRVGEKYLVFAGTRDGKLFTGACSRTKKLEYAESDLRQLGEGKILRKSE